MMDKHALALFGCCEHQQCVNVFYDSIYIGPFYVKDVQCKRYTKTDAIDELGSLQNVLQELRKLMPKRFKKDVTDDMKRELSGMLSMSICVRLVPIDEDFLSKWKACGIDNGVSWNVIELSKYDVERPTEYVGRDKVDSLTLLGENILYTDCWNLLERRHLCFLTDDAKEKVIGADVNESFR